MRLACALLNDLDTSGSGAQVQAALAASAGAESFVPHWWLELLGQTEQCATPDRAASSAVGLSASAATGGLAVAQTGNPGLGGVAGRAGSADGTALAARLVCDHAKLGLPSTTEARATALAAKGRLHAALRALLAPAALQVAECGAHVRHGAAALRGLVAALEIPHTAEAPSVASLSTPEGSLGSAVDSSSAPAKAAALESCALDDGTCDVAADRRYCPADAPVNPRAAAEQALAAVKGACEHQLAAWQAEATGLSEKLEQARAQRCAVFSGR